MLKRFATIVIFLVTASAVNAGCVNYAEDRRTEFPEVLLCIQGKCSETTVAYECANGF